MNKMLFERTRQNRFEKISTIIAERHSLKNGTLTINTHFKNDLGFDSLEMVEIVIDTERMFNISITPEEQKGIESINDLLNLIEKHHD